MHKSLLADLATSKLEPSDINAREAGPPELAAVNISSVHLKGYVIPYYSISGQPLPFYRIKLHDHTPKYKQPKFSENHLYFPPSFQSVLARHLDIGRDKHFIILTEGEKKAACATKFGFPCIAFTGVDSWRTRTFTVPDESKMESTILGKTKHIRIKLPSVDADFIENLTLANGMSELIDLLIRRKLHAIIIYDTDVSEGGRLKPEVQRAAATLGYELRFRGLPVDHIRQAILPNGASGLEKLGLDDYLVKYGALKLQGIIDQTLTTPLAFPRHPNPKTYVNQRLNRRLSRKEAQNISLAIITELDNRGQRLNCTGTNTPYYFDSETHRLMPTILMHKGDEPLHETPFGNFLYREFNISSADSRIIHWLASQFTGEEPIKEVDPRRILTNAGTDQIAVQISDGQFALIRPDHRKPLEILDNGSEGVLFEYGHVEGIDAEELQKQFRRQLHSELEPWWYDVLGTVNMQESNLQSGASSNETTNRARMLATLLFYISPWLNRWRGTQLPIELMIGEAGSGKSSLYTLRLNILTGRPYLRNVPSDLRDWYSSVINTGGLHVIDNVQFTNKDLRQRLSDELCRITTEPTPHIEMRRLYTTSSQLQIPVRAVFAMTAIQQPFFNADIIQRAAIFELDAISRGIDGSWVDHQLERFGGRTRWLAHHLVVLHKFLRAVVHEGAWDPEYPAAHRLVNYEQCLLIMGDVLGLDAGWIPEVLSTAAQTNLTEADWTMEGLKVFAEEMRKERAHLKQIKVVAADIGTWAETNDDYSENNMLTNSRRLGRYIQSHKSTIKRITGITVGPLYGNRRQFIVGHPQK